jgi:hypothetical protein
VPKLGHLLLTGRSPAGTVSMMKRVEAYRGFVKGLFGSDFNTFQSLWVEEHLRLMLSLRRYFGNDMDKIIIMAVIGQQQLRDPSLPKRAYAPVSDDPVLGDQSRYTNVDRISAATGIPRESVRRKVHELISVGWLERTGTRALSVRPQAAVDMQPATLTVFDVLDRLFAEFAAELVQRGTFKIELPCTEAGQKNEKRSKARE